METDIKRPVLDHLEELRWRLLKSVAVLIVTTCSLFYFVKQIIPYIVKPVGRVVFISPTEAFVTNIKIALYGGVFLSSPFILYQIWTFVAVALKKNEKKFTLLFFSFSLIFFIIGACFGYFLIVPIGMKFLLKFSMGDILTPNISFGKYVSFVGILSLTFGIVFQLPLAMVFITKIGIVTPEIFSQKRRAVIVLIFIAAALFTPPDPVTQCFMALPLLVLFELGIILSRLVNRKKRDKASGS